MIGIFDSGFGGLTVLRQLKKELPKLDYIYLGDNARAPYGSKSHRVIYDYTVEGIEFLFKQGCEIIIIACNTASAKALKEIQEKYLPKKHPNKKVLGVLIPVAEVLVEKIKEAKKIKNPKIGIIGTKATINSKSYDKEIKKFLPNIKIISVATPLLVPLVEESWIKRKETKMILRRYLIRIKRAQVAYLILGCTHYPFLKKQIKSIIGKNTEIISTPKAVAKKLKEYLKKHTEIKLKKEGKSLFYTTNKETEFKTFYQKTFTKKLDNIKSVKL